MQPSEHAFVIEIIAGVAVLWFAHSYMWRRTRMRAFREDTFTMRDELFDYMWKNGVSYDLSAYREMRSLFNGAIRTIAYLRGPLVLHVTSRFEPDESSILKTVESIEDPKVKEHFQRVFLAYGFRLIRYIGIHWFILAAVCEVRRQRRRRQYHLRINEIRERVTWDIADELVRYGERNTPQARAMAQLAPSNAR